MLHGKYPALQIYVREDRPAAIERDVVTGDLDCGLIPTPASGHALTFRRICRETIYLGVGKDHRLATSRRIKPRQLKGERLLTLGRGHHLFERAREFAAASGADMREDYEGTSLDALRQMVVMGMGASLFPRALCPLGIPRAGPCGPAADRGWPASRDMGYVWRASNGRAAQSRNWPARANRPARPSVSTTARQSRPEGGTFVLDSHCPS